MFDAELTGPFVGRDFLSPAALLRVLSALAGLAPLWRPSDELGLVGRGGAFQVRGGELAAQPHLDGLSGLRALAALQWAQRCGFRFESAPRLQLFPVRMVVDLDAPVRQESHVDSLGDSSLAPICTSVFYAAVRAADGA